MKLFNICKKEITNLSKNKMKIVAIIAISIIPLLYTFCYLKAYWDPYGDLTNYKIAVVNKDTGSTLDGEAVNYGKDAVDKIKDNKDVHFVFVSEDDAKQGLKDDKYFASIEFPTDFSEKIAKAKDGSAKAPEIKYVSNNKKNYIATKISDTVKNKVIVEVKQAISEEYGSTAFSSIYESRDGLKDAVDGTNKLIDGTGKLSDGNNQLTDGLKSLNSQVPTLTNGVGQLTDGSVQLKNGLGELNGQIPTLVSGINQLYSGSNTLNDGAKKAYAGSSTLNSKSADLNNGINKASEAFNNSILGSCNTYLPQLANGANALNDGLNQLNSQVPALTSGVNQLNSGASEVNKGTQNLNAGLSSLKDGTKSAADGASKLSDGIDKSAEGISKLADGSNSLSAGADALDKGVNQLIDSTKQSQAAIQSATDNYLKAYLAKHPEAMKDEDMQKYIKSMQEISKQASSEETQKEITKLQQGSQAVAAGAKDLKNGANELNTKFADVQNGSKALKAGTEQLAAGAESAYDGSTKLAAGTKSLAAGTNDLSKGAGALAGGAKQLVDGSKQLSDGLNTFSPTLINGLNDYNKQALVPLQSGIKQYTGGVSDLNNGLKQIAGGTSQLNGGLNQVYVKTPALSSGVSQLYDGSTQLNGGLNELNSKLPDLASGAQKLQDGSVALGDGLISLSDGHNELKTGLSDGITKINSKLKTPSDELGKFVGKPVEVNTVDLDKIDNYGTGLSPYFLPISLWLGAVLMLLVIKMKSSNFEDLNRFEIVIGKYVNYALLGVMQAVLLGGVVYALGITPKHPGLLFLLLIVSALTFDAILYALVSILGLIGEAIAIILLVMQLCSDGGTFPIEVLPAFFQNASKVLPFTYVVEAVKEVLFASSINMSLVIKDLLILVLFGVLSLLFAFIFCKQGEAVNETIETALDGDYKE